MGNRQSSDASLMHDILGEHKVLGDITMLGSSHPHISIKEKDAVELLQKHITSADLYYIVTTFGHQYSMCLSFFADGHEHSLVATLEKDEHLQNGASAAEIIRKAIPEKRMAYIALVDIRRNGTLALVSMEKVQSYVPSITWGNQGTKCEIKFKYDWTFRNPAGVSSVIGDRFAAHDVILDSWDVESHINACRAIDEAILAKRMDPQKLIDKEASAK